MEHKDAVFENQEVLLDGNTYNQCKFRKCRLVFNAEGGSSLKRCEFDGCTWKLGGSAKLTIDFLSSLYQMEGMRTFMEATFENIRRGPRS